MPDNYIILGQDGKDTEWLNTFKKEAERLRKIVVYFYTLDHTEPCLHMNERMPVWAPAYPNVTFIEIDIEKFPIYGNVYAVPQVAISKGEREIIATYNGSNPSQLFRPIEHILTNASVPTREQPSRKCKEIVV